MCYNKKKTQGVAFVRLQIVKSKNAESFYVIKSLYVSKKNTTRVVEKLGTRAELEKKLNGADPILWAKKYIAELNRLEKEKKLDIVIKYSQNQIIEKDEKRLFNCGYLFLQKIYNELKLPIICKEIGKKYKYDFDMNSILSRLVYGRIIFPRSKNMMKSGR